MYYSEFKDKLNFNSIADFWRYSRGGICYDWYAFFGNKHFLYETNMLIDSKGRSFSKIAAYFPKTDDWKLALQVTLLVLYGFGFSCAGAIKLLSTENAELPSVNEYVIWIQVVAQIVLSTFTVYLLMGNYS